VSSLLKTILKPETIVAGTVEDVKEQLTFADAAVSSWGRDSPFLCAPTEIKTLVQPTAKPNSVLKPA
jgi:hypothetical protein